MTQQGQRAQTKRVCKLTYRKLHQLLNIKVAALNIVICHACKIVSFRSTMESCKELFAVFDNSLKCKKFLDKVIDSLSAETKKRKLKDLCKTRWVERHSTFETLFELYEYIVIALNEICHPSNDESIYPDNECWNWDSETRTKANGLRHTFTNFEHIVSFICFLLVP